MASTTLFTFLSIYALSLLTTASAVGFSVELIHRDHPKSPLYNPTFSLSDRVHAAVWRSHARAKSLRRNFFSRLYTDMSSATNNHTHIPNSPSPASPNAPIETDIIANSEYLMVLHLGTPSRKIIAIADTGSDLMWVTCKPCSNCYQQDAPLFNPANSSSYANLPCSSKQCHQLPFSWCDDSSLFAPKCIYKYYYGDRSQTSGTLARETVTFKTTFGSSVGFPGVTFGCLHVANGTLFDRDFAGLIGLGAGPLSLVSQLGSSIEHRFSYCLVIYGSTNVTTSRLNFGSDAVISGDDVVTTRMVHSSEDTFYTVTLDGITVGKNNTLNSI